MFRAGNQYLAHCRSRGVTEGFYRCAVSGNLRHWGARYPLGIAANAADVRPVPSMRGRCWKTRRCWSMNSARAGTCAATSATAKITIGDVINVGTPSSSNATISTKPGWLASALATSWHWLRADLTVDYGNKANFTGDSSLQADDFTAKVDSFTGMVNIYADLGTWSGLRPISAPASASRICGRPISTRLTGHGDTAPGRKWNFAWAYMAGLSYRLRGIPTSTSATGTSTWAT